VRITADTPLVLGSASPRRRELLLLLGLPVVVHPARADESARAGDTPNAYLDRIVAAKLDAVRSCPKGPGAGSSLRRGQAVLVADTIVVAPDGTILGKPSGEEQSRAMLGRLAGATHDVRTRFALADSAPDSPAAHAQTVTTRVTFRAFEAGELRDYVEGGEGNDKAGGYAVQGMAAAFVQRIDGSYTNVVGLPLCEVVVALRKLGWLTLR
jgi:septum formation protein